VTETGEHEVWWNEADRRRWNCSERSVSRCNIFHHKSHMKQPGNEPVFPRSEVDNYVAQPVTRPYTARKRIPTVAIKRRIHPVNTSARC